MPVGARDGGGAGCGSAPPRREGRAKGDAGEVEQAHAVQVVVHKHLQLVGNVRLWS